MPFWWGNLGETDNTYATYMECIDAGQTTQNDPTAAKIIGFFEKKYNCAGICKPPLFYVTKPLSEGWPKEACLKHIQAEISNSSMYVGVIALLVGILMFAAWVMQYCLWKKF